MKQNKDIFQQQKQKQLSKIDKSNIGQIDPKIKPLCNKMKNNPSKRRTKKTTRYLLIQDS